MSATQTVTTTTRKWVDRKNNDTKETGQTVASAYAASLKKANKVRKAKRVCPTCGRPL